MNKLFVRRVLASALACASFAVMAVSNPLSVSINSAQTALKADQDVNISVTMVNQSSLPVKVLKWYTPIGKVTEPLFEVVRDGKPVAYRGAHYKRMAPSAKDFIELKAGEAVTRNVELSAIYDFSVTGSYAIRYNVGSAQLVASAVDSKGGPVFNGDVVEMKSGNLTLWVDGRLPAGTVTTEATPDYTSGGVSYTGNCSSSRKSSILTALTGAQNYANAAYSYLSGSGSGTPRFTTWFGTYSSSHWSTAKSHYANISNAFNVKPITVDCSCTDSGTYAYVYPDSPYKIYVCGAFWSAPNTGTDSRSGTFVHEMSHFTVVAGTNDWVYGQSGAKSLAKSNSTKALDNADNHEYFAENNPFQN